MAVMRTYDAGTRRRHSLQDLDSMQLILIEGLWCVELVRRTTITSQAAVLTAVRDTFPKLTSIFLRYSSRQIVGLIGFCVTLPLFHVGRLVVLSLITNTECRPCQPFSTLADILHP
jgi:hypothetical protein